MNFLIKNGTVYDPASHKLYKGDIAIKGRRIADPAEVPDARVIDAEDCLVTTGLIDYHVHYFNFGSENSVNADATSFCTGITTAVDGGTAGVGQIELFRRTTAFSEVGMKAYLLIASGGQSNDRYPENLDPAFFDEDGIVDLFERYPDQLVGLKTRISHGIIEGDMARASLRRTVEIAEKAGTRVIVHVTNSALPIDEIAAMLRPGDVICHIYQGAGDNICLDENGNVLPGLLEARDRGVLFDASNGRRNYNLEICRKALSQGFMPDVISSDINVSSCFLQPLHSLPRILSKFLDMGMSLEQVLDCATLAPAKLIGMPELADMSIGTPADICIFKLKEKDVAYCDFDGNTFVGHKVLVPQMTFKAGKCMYCQADFT